MSASELSFKTATELTDMLAANQVSAVELAQDTIARIERYDAQINAVCVRDFDRGLAAARAADAALARGDRKPLLGIPMTVKESFNVAGLPTTWGFVPQKDFVPSEDALAIARVKDAGAVILAKTNVPFGLADWQSYNDIYGTTNNPYDLGRTPGGSSGGSSAALAAGFGALSLGSDLAGSLRAPAHYCGIAAHKPTFNLTPMRGHTAPPAPPLTYERDLSVIGPMARSAADCALLLDVVAGPDPRDLGIAYKLDLPRARHDSIKDFRVLVVDQHPLVATASDVRAAVDVTAERLERVGARVSRDPSLVPDLASASRLYMRMITALTGAAMPLDAYIGARDAAAKLPESENGLAAERLRGVAISHRDWLAASGQRARLRAAWRSFFETFDAVICPVMPTAAFPHDHSTDTVARRVDIDGVSSSYNDQMTWPGLVNVSGLPATAIPVTQSRDGLPIGIQIIGPWLEDRTSLKLASLIEREWGGFVPPPHYS